MKIVTISMELGIDNMDDEIDFSNKESVADFLSKMLYEDPEWFGGFGPENITSIVNVESDDEAYWKRKSEHH
ncbi:hypothetical protein EB118_17770 [bacterium]|nr:hypothetical protein [bacterium]NDG31908.1 hypothetical protein [bacterium]